MSQLDSPLASPADLRHKARVALVNATVLYVLAYLLAHGLYQLGTILMARRLSVPGIWELGGIRFTIADRQWVRVAVVAVYGAGPLMCLGLLLVAAGWFWRRARLQRGLSKQFLLWLAFHACNQVFGGLVADTVTKTGFWYVPAWAFWVDNALNIAIAVGFGLVQMVLGYFAAIPFLQGHDSITLMQYQNRRLLLLSTLFGPWLLGSAVLAGLRWPALTLNESLHFATLLLLIVPLAAGCFRELFEFTIAAPRKTRVAAGLVLLTLLVLVAVRVVLGRGVPFG